MTHDPARREALRLCALAAGAWLAPSPALAASSPTARDEDALDAALARLRGEEPLARQGLSTHAPMAAEALCAMGQGDRIASWVEGYGRGRLELPRATRPIDPARWSEALGLQPQAGSWEQQNPRWGDWVVHFEQALREQPWPAVLDRWVARLAPGFGSAATHGVIRTAHAARALARRPSAERQAELARGLAYWASSFQPLPAATVPLPRRSDLDFSSLPLYADRHGAPPRGSFVAGLAAAAAEPGLLAAIDRYAPASPEAAWPALAELGARAFLRHGLRAQPLAFLHAITGPLALRRLAPHLRAETLAAALPHAWRTAALLYAAYARRDPGPLPERPAVDRATLAGRAAEHGDEHVIKLTDAALEPHVETPSLLAAARAAQDVL